jgi:hypothetical protein
MTLHHPLVLIHKRAVRGDIAHICGKYINMAANMAARDIEITNITNDGVNGDAQQQQQQNNQCLLGTAGCNGVVTLAQKYRPDRGKS